MGEPVGAEAWERAGRRALAGLVRRRKARWGSGWGSGEEAETLGDTVNSAWGCCQGRSPLRAGSQVSFSAGAALAPGAP